MKKLLLKNVKSSGKSKQTHIPSLDQPWSLLRATLESIAEGILVVDLNGKILNYNTPFLKIWNLSKDILDKQDVHQVLEDMFAQLPEAYIFERSIRKFKKTIASKTPQCIQSYKKRVIEYYSKPYRVEKSIAGRVWVFRDITEQTLVAEKLTFQATHDSVTHLPNRILFMDRMQQAINFAQTHKTIFAILFLDLDHFKNINDQLMHEFGDKLLYAVGKRLSALIRSEDTIARFGGDEFVLIAQLLHDVKDAATLAQKILTSFQQVFRIHNQKILLSTSIGIACYPKDGKSMKDLLHHADLAMYHAKEKGGNQYRYYENALTN